MTDIIHFPVLEFLEQNASSCNYQELAEGLNAAGFSRACGRPFNRSNVFRIMKDHEIKNMKQRYFEKGWLSIKTAADLQGISVPALRYRIKAGIYTGKYIVVEENGTALFDPETIPADCDLNIKIQSNQPKKNSPKKNCPRKDQVQSKILDFLDKNAENHINKELAELLNEQGYTKPNGKPYDGLYLNQLMRSKGIKTLKQRYIDKGWLTLNDSADRLGIPPIFLKIQVIQGLFKGSYIIADGNNFLLFDPKTLTK